MSDFKVGRETEALLDSWNGRFALLNDGDEWMVNAIDDDKSIRLLAVCASKEEATARGRALAGASLRSLIPSKRWIVGYRDQSKQLLSLGARYDPLYCSWFIPDTLYGERFEKLSERLPRGVKRVLLEQPALVAREAREADFEDRIVLQASAKDARKLKSLGAQYNPIRKTWFISRKGPLRPFLPWLPESIKAEIREDLRSDVEGVLSDPQYLRIPFDDELRARAFGALYVRERDFWVAPAGSMEKDFEEWLRIPCRLSPRLSFSRKLLAFGFDRDRTENRDFQIQPDGQKHRFFVQGDFDRPSGEYSIYLNENSVGWISNYRTRIFEKWFFPYRGDYRANLSKVPFFVDEDEAF